MLSGVELGEAKESANKVEIEASAKTGGTVQIWLDDLSTGRLIATVPVNPTGGQNNFKAFTKALKNVAGQHDVFVKFTKATDHDIFIKSIRFRR